MSRNVIVTSALPYANGPIHFGHVVGAYLPADIYTRFRRMCGDRVHYVCGTDEHGVAITLKAEEAGQSYEEYVDHWHAEISRILSDVGIEFDIFSGTSNHRNPFHRPLAQQFFASLLENGYLMENTEEQFFSESLGRFLPDRYVTGTCYVCGNDQARGDECPQCGTWIDAKKLKEPRSSIDGAIPVLRETKHWYLDLQRVRDEWLGEWFKGKHEDWKVNVRRFVEIALEDLRERPITRDLPWGVPVPLADADEKVLYVWFDAPIGYLSISQQFFEEQKNPEEFERLWKDPETELFHFIGKDNITFHAIVFPSMLWGTKQGWTLPTNIPANEFFNLEGKKFNTSAGWFIPEDSIKGRYPVDALRYALTTMMPETADSDWSWREFQARVNGELADNLGNFVARCLRFTDRFLEGTIPPQANLSQQDTTILASADSAADEIAEHFRAFRFRMACQRLMAFSNECNKYFDEEQPWVTRKSDLDRCKQTIRVCTELIRTLAILCAPIMPGTSRDLLQALGLNDEPCWADAGGQKLSPEPIQIEPLPVLFPKIEDTVIEDELAKLQSLAASKMGDEKEPAEPLADSIDFDAFMAVDLRAATVIEAEKHPKADRLLVLSLDMGFETRTVVAGIAATYSADELKGRKVAVVANLAPRKLRGIESQGMVLAADDVEGNPRIVAVDPQTPDGTRIR